MEDMEKLLARTQCTSWRIIVHVLRFSL